MISLAKEEKEENEESEEDKEDEKMEEEENLTSENKSFKEKVMHILNEVEMSTRRSSKLSLDDFLTLLHHFNTNGIHFR